MRVRARLQAGLENLLARGPGRERDHFGILEGVGQRRFAIDVFARVQGGDSDITMLMRRRGDDDGLNLLVVQDFPVILNAFCIGRRVGRAFQRSGISVADRHQLCGFEPGQSRDDFAAPVAQADDAALDLERHQGFEVGGLDRRMGHQLHPAQHGHQGRKRADKIPAVQLGSFVLVHKGAVYFVCGVASPFSRPRAHWMPPRMCF